MPGTCQVSPPTAYAMTLAPPVYGTNAADRESAE